ncbi:MAG: RdgB/HAM1 family non-canonical purine NTP pyrophosphatase [Anaerolineales bacterium]
MIKLLLATNNQGKLAELRSLLDGLDLVLLSPADLGLNVQVQERGINYLENSVLKAAIFAQASKIWALADDSGLEVEALDGAPGIFSARYAPQPGATDKDRRRFLVQNLEKYPRPWKASFQSVVTLVGPEGSPIVTRGTCQGEIIPEGKGDGGFGYDRIFQLEDSGLTMAELTPEQKNSLSHRALAVRKLIPVLQGLFAEEMISG